MERAKRSKAERPKAKAPKVERPKAKPTWTDVKAKLTEFDRAGLMQLVSDLYAFHRDNQAFLHARFNLGKSPLDDYKKRIALALAPDLSRKLNANISVASARKAISEYNKAVGDPLGVLELRIYFCEVAIKFSMEYGFADEGYFDAVANQYRDACGTLSAVDEPLLSTFIERLDKIRVDAQVGYGLTDYMGDVLGDVVVNLPGSDVDADEPQLKGA